MPANPYRRFRRPLTPPLDFQRRDRRGFDQGYAPLAVDLLHGERVQREIADAGLVPMEAVLENLTAHNLPPQIIQGGTLQYITAQGRAGQVLLIPKNPWRQGFLVANFTGSAGVLFSFDQPFDTGITGFQLAGIPMGGYYQEANGSVSTNDIWVFCDADPAEVSYPIPILGYEAQLSITGNRR